MNKTSVEFWTELYIFPETFKTRRTQAVLVVNMWFCYSEERTVAPQLCTWWYDVEEIFEIVHPDFSQAPVVLVDDLARSSGEAVWGGLPENMAHVRTCYNFQRATALPDLQTHTDNVDLYSI